MGIALSLNYSNVTPHFNFGIWKVSKAIHKSTNRPVSLWIIDYDLMKERERNKKNRRRYIQFLMEAILNQQKIQHLNILKIFEVQSAKKKIGFSSEQIETNLFLTGNNKYTRDESIYITQQISTTMRYVHDVLHTAFMGIYPENIFLNSHFTLKLGMFIHSCPFQLELSRITDPFILFSPGSIFHVPCNWCAPEVVRGENFTSRSEIYMFGLLSIYIFTRQIPSKTSSSINIDTKGPLELCSSIPEEFQDLIKNCISNDPASRPNFDSITNDDAFSSLVAKIFQYIEVIREKSDRDLFNFFKGLKSSINAFSDRIIKQKFMPIFIYYVQKDQRFSYALLPIFINCIGKYSEREYVDNVLRPIKPVLTQFENPKVNSLLLEYLGTLVKRVPSEFHEELVFPIAFSCFKSSDLNVVMGALQIMPALIAIMKASFIRSDALPSLLSLAESSQVPDVVINVVGLVALAMGKTGNEFVAETAFPVLQKVWVKLQWPKLADSLADLVMLCEVPVELLFTTTLQMALLIIANSKVQQVTHARMIKYVQSALQKISKQYRISGADFEAASKMALTAPACPQTKLRDILEEEEEDGDDANVNTSNNQFNFLNTSFTSPANQSPAQIQPPSAQQQPGRPGDPFGGQISPQPTQRQNDPFGVEQPHSQKQQQNHADQFSDSNSILQQRPVNPYTNQNSSSSFQQQRRAESFSQKQQHPQAQADRSGTPQNQSFFPQYQQQPVRKVNSTASFQQPSNNNNQQHQIPLQSNNQYSSSFDIFNQQQRQQNSNSYEIFRNTGNNQQTQQQNRPKVNPYEDEGFKPYNF